MNIYEKAIQYVRDNKTWTDAEEQVAIDNIDHWRCSIGQAYPPIADKIIDLMEEFGEDNGYPEGWWYEYGDEDDVFFKL